ncbi:hypothetical protein [Methanosarcina siciliae]|uniref:hypothetical protein n=1 Tax=Methanosarcina siciliae TaxID=38027 RepID=UPI000AE8154A|nr:hypothetical protein [Methanosarcina siciliae]
MYCRYLVTANPDYDTEFYTCEVAPKKGKLPAEVLSKYCKGEYENCQRFTYRSRLMG